MMSLPQCTLHKALCSAHCQFGWRRLLTGCDSAASAALNALIFPCLPDFCHGHGSVAAAASGVGWQLWLHQNPNDAGWVWVAMHEQRYGSEQCLATRHLLCPACWQPGKDLCCGAGILPRANLLPMPHDQQPVFLGVNGWDGAVAGTWLVGGWVPASGLQSLGAKGPVSKEGPWHGGGGGGPGVWVLHDPAPSQGMREVCDVRPPGCQTRLQQQLKPTIAMATMLKNCRQGLMLHYQSNHVSPFRRSKQVIKLNCRQMLILKNVCWSAEALYTTKSHLSPNVQGLFQHFHLASTALHPHLNSCNTFCLPTLLPCWTFFYNVNKSFSPP